MQFSVISTLPLPSVSLNCSASDSKTETPKEKVSTIQQTLALRKKIESIENKEPSLSEEAYYQQYL